MRSSSSSLPARPAGRAASHRPKSRLSAAIDAGAGLLQALRASRWLPALIVVDLAMCGLHVLSRLGWSHNPMLLLNHDGGIAEWWQYLKEAGVAVVLLAMWRRTVQPVYLAWGLVYGYVLVDDSAMLHERLGVLLEAALPAVGHFGLRIRDFGELLASALAGACLLVGGLLAYRRSAAPARSHARVLLVCFASLAFFGVAIDMAHQVLQSLGLIQHGLAFLEDAGELVAMSVTAAYALALLGYRRI